MADVASLSLEVKTDSLKQATAELRALPIAATAAERAAMRWGEATTAAARSTEDFSRRVQRTIKDLEFERQQLVRSADEKQRYATLRRAGVAEASREGQAIMASVAALQAQRAALGHVSLGTRAAGQAAAAATAAFRTMAASIGPIALVLLAMQKVMQAFETASGLDEVAEQIGVTAKNLQALQFAATQSGVKMEQLDTGLSKFSQKMGEAAEGSKEMVESLTKLGVKNLDVAGNLRPTEDLLVDIAKAITSIDDPARRSAAAVDFFGKAGTRMLPVLAEIAGGMDALGQKASEAGAIIDAKTIKVLDDLADSMARTSQVGVARLANAMAMLVTIAQGVTLAFSRLADDVGSSITRFVDAVEVGGVRASAMFIEAFRAMPDALGQLFTNAWESARVATAKGINSLTSLLPSWMGLGGGTDLNTTPTGTGQVGAGMGARISAAGDAAVAEMLQRQATARQAAMQSDEERARMGKIGVMGGPSTTGAATSAIKGAGKEAEDAEKKYEKLITTLTQTATAQDQMTAAAGRGETAFEAMKAHLEAQQKALEIYGKVLDDTDPKLRKIEELLLRIAQGKAAEAFSSATNELKQQNIVLDAQIKLMGEAPEIQAREIALIKAKQEAEKAGTAITQDMIDARTKAIEQNETLKNQQEEIKKAQDLWTAPLKSALESLQSTAADAFESMLESGKVSFQALGEVFKKTLIRMAAEFLALATIRPVMSVIVNAISPGMASQFGLGGASSGVGGLGGIGDFLGQTLVGGSENFGPLQPGAASLGSSGGLSIGGALGGLAGIGMGAYSMFSGGGGMGSMLGGGLGIAGGLTSMLGPMLGLGAAAGPVGLGLGLLGGILPSLFGGGQARTPPVVRTSQNVPLSKDVQSLFNLFGGVKNPGALWGLGTETISQTGEPGWDFTSTSTFLKRPGGGQELWRQDMEDMLQTGSAQVAVRSIIDGAVGEITESMRKGLTQVSHDTELTMESLSEAVNELMAFDNAVKNFGKTITPMEAAFEAVDDSLSSLYATAAKFGLDTSAVDAEQWRQKGMAAQDFFDGLFTSLQEISDPTGAAISRLDKERADAVATNNFLISQYGAGVDQIANIELLYQTQRQAIIEEGNAAALAAQQQASNAVVSMATANLNTVQGLIRQLSPGGALSNLDPTSQLAGLRATSKASFAQANADPSSADAVARAVQDAQALAQFSQSYYGGSSAYSRERNTILNQATALQSNIVQGAITRVTDPQQVSLLQQILTALSKRNGEFDQLVGLLQRQLAA